MSPEQIWPLIQVILVDLMLAADNAIVIGLAAASVPAALRPGSSCSASRPLPF